MNKINALLLLSLATLLLLPFTALGIGFPHDASNGIDCDSCHNPAPPGSGATSYDNMCTGCHNNNKPLPKHQFTYEDAANIFNRTPVAPSAMMISHNWAGSMDAPQAGASIPTDPVLLPGDLGPDQLSCARCHNVHNDVADPLNPHLLRANNNDDGMCRNCHRNRDAGRNTTDKLGTHPINFTYTSASSKTKTKLGEYFVPPRNANINNPASAMNLVNGKVICSTCHAVHYADSRSNLGHSGVDNYYQLSSSRGMLLRTDTFGQSDETSSVNICTNCHNKPNHQVYPGSRTKTQNKPIQCVDCHSGHVEYIKPEDKLLTNEPQNLIPNVYLLRRYMNYSNGVKLGDKLDSYRRKAFLTSTSSSAIFMDPINGKAICQACHSLPTSVPAHSTVTNKGQCFDCHAGGTHSPQKPIQCGGCHGYPPQHTIPGNFTNGGTGTYGGYAVYSSSLGVSKLSYANSGIYKNESTAGHPTHAAGKPYNFSCAQCHNKNDLNHNKNSYQDVPFTSPGINSPQSLYNTTTSTCSNVYCHSYGMATLTKPKIVTWAAGRDTIVKSPARCAQCHNGAFGGSQPFNNMSTNAHFRHVGMSSASGKTGKGITCNVCHSATVSNNTTISNYRNHVNKVVNLAADSSAVNGKLIGQVGSSNQSLSGATCIVYCHSDGKGIRQSPAPNWKGTRGTVSTGWCNTCHVTATSSSRIKKYGHLTHFSSSIGPRLVGNNSCTLCHSTSSDIPFSELGSTHVDGKVDVNYLNGTCTTECHRNGIPTWTSSARLECRTCHDGNISHDTRPGFNSISAPRKSMFNFSTVGHGQINSNGNAWPTTRYTCTSCHNNNSKHISGVRGDTRRLPVGKDTSRVAGFDGNNVLCSTCHAANRAAQKKIRPTHYAFRNQTSTPTMQCARCHDVHGTGNERMIAKAISFHPDSSAYVINYVSPTPTSTTYTFIQMSPPYRGLCQVCHTQTNHFRRGQSDFNTSHASYDYTTNCLGCHSHRSGVSAAGNVAFQPSACNGCHGYPPVRRMIGNMGHHNNYSTAQLQNYSGGGGAHAVAGHLLPTVNASEAWTNCTKCHYETKKHSMITSKFAANSTATRKSNVNVIVDPKYKFNANLPLTEDQYIKSSPGNSGRCSNVSCHFQKTPKWGGDDDK